MSFRDLILGPHAVSYLQGAVSQSRHGEHYDRELARLRGESPGCNDSSSPAKPPLIISTADIAEFNARRNGPNIATVLAFYYRHKPVTAIADGKPVRLRDWLEATAQDRGQSIENLMRWIAEMHAS